MRSMTYKGFSASVEYSDEDRCFVGRLLDVRDIVGFHGATFDDARPAFEEAVDDYLRAKAILADSFEKDAVAP